MSLSLKLMARSTCRGLASQTWSPDPAAWSPSGSVPYRDEDFCCVDCLHCPVCEVGHSMISSCRAVGGQVREDAWDTEKRAECHLLLSPGSPSSHELLQDPVLSWRLSGDTSSRLIWNPLLHLQRGHQGAGLSPSLDQGSEATRAVPRAHAESLFLWHNIVVVSCVAGIAVRLLMQHRGVS